MSLHGSCGGIMIYPQQSSENHSQPCCPSFPYFFPSFLRLAQHLLWPHHGLGTGLNTVSVKMNPSRSLPTRMVRHMSINNHNTLLQLLAETYAKSPFHIWGYPSVWFGKWKHGLKNVNDLSTRLTSCSVLKSFLASKVLNFSTCEKGKIIFSSSALSKNQTDLRAKCLIHYQSFSLTYILHIVDNLINILKFTTYDKYMSSQVLLTFFLSVWSAYLTRANSFRQIPSADTCCLYKGNLLYPENR